MAEFWMWWLQAISFHCFNMLCYISASYNCSNADLHHIPRYSEQCQVSLQLHGSRYGLPVRTDRTTDHIWPKRVGFRLCEFAVAVYHLIPNPSQMPMSAKAPEGRKEEGWSPTSAWFWRHVKWARPIRCLNCVVTIEQIWGLLGLNAMSLVGLYEVR